MKMDAGFADQKLSLDVTPLIDIIFLLVLFFAVSTSFISAEDLSELKGNVVSLGNRVAALRAEKDALSSDKQDLVERSRQMQETVATLNRQLAGESGKVEDLRAQLIESDQKAEQIGWMIDKLESERGSLQDTLARSQGKVESLDQQLQQAYEDYKNLDVQLAGLRTESQRQADEERLLRALLLERAQQSAQLERQLASTQAEADALSASEKSLRADMAAAATKNLSLNATVTRLVDEREQQARQESLLQALIAEKAAQALALQDQLEGARSRNRTLNDDLANLASQNQQQVAGAAGLREEILRLRAELGNYKKVADLDQAQVERILEAQQTLRAGLSDYLADNRLGIKRERQRLVLQLSDQILFNSGSSTVNREGIDVLRKVGNIINARSANLEVQIAGHTDNVPVSNRTGPLGSNWGLSAARAVNVVRFLQEDVGIDAARMSAVGYGEHRPVASNESERGRASNRRIEIVLVPR